MNSTWTISSTLDWTTDFFKKAMISEARIEAEILLASVLNCPRYNLILNKHDVVPHQKLDIYKKLISDRHSRKPIAYILEEQEFMGLKFKINNHTLIPRPETELLVEEAVRIIEIDNLETAIEIGTGSGNIAVSISKLSKISRVYAVDINIDALKICQENIDYHGQSAKIQLRKGDLFKAVDNESLEQNVDMIISNPPYILSNELSILKPEIGFEPKIALDGGEDGLTFYKQITQDSRKFLKDNGYLLFEMNSKLSDEISAILEQNKFIIINIIKDYSGLNRVVTARKLL